MDNRTVGFGSNCPTPNSPSLHPSQKLLSGDKQHKAEGLLSYNLQYILVAFHFRADTSSEVKIYNPAIIQDSLDLVTELYNERPIPKQNKLCC